jgi:TonB family protein
MNIYNTQRWLLIFVLFTGLFLKSNLLRGQFSSLKHTGKVYKFKVPKEHPLRGLVFNYAKKLDRHHVAIIGRNGVFGLVDEDANIIFPLLFSNIEVDPSSDMLLIYTKDSMAVYNPMLRKVVFGWHTYIEPFSRGWLRMSEANEDTIKYKGVYSVMGYCNTKGERLNEYIFYSGEIMTDEGAKVSFVDGDGYGILYPNGKLDSFDFVAHDKLKGKPKSKERDSIFSLLDVQTIAEPAYNLDDFISRNIEYPSEERDKGVSGEIKVRFMVNANGNISDISIAKTVSRNLSAECIRILGLMPPWTPAMQDGKPVRISFTKKIVFALE